MSRLGWGLVAALFGASAWAGGSIELRGTLYTITQSAYLIQLSPYSAVTVPKTAVSPEDAERLSESINREVRFHVPMDQVRKVRTPGRR